MQHSLLFILIFTITITSVAAHQGRTEDEPDDALCTQFSGRNSTCSSCILQGCSYCDVTGTGHSGLCLSTKTAHDTCNTTNILISSFSSLTLCQRTEHDLYESIAAFIPIICTFIASIAFITLGWYVKPTYAPIPPAEEQVMHVGENPNAPLLGDSRWYRIQQHWQQTRIAHITRSSGWCVKLFITALFITVLILTIITIAVQMWSIQIDGENQDDDDLETATSAIFYGTFGLHTVTRNPSHHDDLIFRFSNYNCNNLHGDNYIRCSLHRIVSVGAGVSAAISLAFLCIVALQLVLALFCCRSLSNYSVKFMTLSAITSWSAVCVYVGGAFLLQSRIFDDVNDMKATTTTPTPYHLYLGVSWDCCLAAAIINTFMLIPLTRIHIHAIQPPTSNQCCWRRKRSSSHQHDAIAHAPMGVDIAIAQENPFLQPQQAPSQPQYVYGAYQQGSVQQATPPSQRPSQPSVGQPLLGFTND